MINKILLKVIISVSSMVFMGDIAHGQAQTSLGLVYNKTIQSPGYIPNSERNLQTVTAELWYKVADHDTTLEGIILDRQGNVYFCNVTDQVVLKLTKNKHLSKIISLKDFAPGGLAFDQKGHLLIAASNFDKGLGTIVSVRQDGTDLKTIISAQAGYMPNDIIFDAKGGFYFSDFRGTATDAVGGIYYVAPDYKIIKSVIPHLALADGVALSPDGKFLWATEFGRNLLHRERLDNATTISSVGGSVVPYHFIGAAPDSMRVDGDGNVYVAMYGQGRVLVFNRNGAPIAQILLPERDQGHNLRSTSIGINPNTNDLYIVAGGENGGAIFHTTTFTHGL